MSNVSHYLLLKKIDIEGANAISSPLTYGFPAITGFLGAIHSLNRNLFADGYQLDLSGILIACHDIHVQRYRPHPYADYTFNQSRNPIKKDGSTASIIEEGKAHLTISLVIEISASLRTASTLTEDKDEFEQNCRNAIMQQPMAGGSVRDIQFVELLDSSETSDIKKELLPAFVLMDARDDLIEITRGLQRANPEATELDALIEVATLHNEPVDTSIHKSGWQTRSAKTGRGWLAPIPVGFQAIAPQFPPGKLTNCRSTKYPSQYVEAIYSLGKWVFPNRLPDSFNQCFWRYNQLDNLFIVNQTTI